jgi:hypothetical protein
MSVKISSLNTASTIDSGDDINIAGNNPLKFSDWGGGWYMMDGTWIRSYNAKSLWIGAGVIGGDGGLTIGYGGTSYGTNNAIIAGSVGIGTNAPIYKLDVNSGSSAISARFYSPSNDSTVVYVGGTANTGFSDLVLYSNSGSGEIFKAGTGYTSYGGALALNIYNSNGAIAFHPNSIANAMFIATNGRIGVGTDTPSTDLDVRGSANFRGSTYYGVTLERTATGGNIYLYEGNSPKIYLQSADNIIFNNGYNFGIGTGSPQKTLDVAIGANNFVTVGAVTSMGVGQWAGIHFGYRENNTLYRKSAIVFERTDNAGGGGNAAGKVYILNGPGIGAGSATLADAKLTIDEYGKVGIGTTTPGYLLDVNGTARVSGQVVSNTQFYVAGTPNVNSGDLISVRDTSATGSNTTFGGVFFNSSPGNDYSIGKLTENSVGFLQIRNGNNGAELLRINNTGAATFASSVTATNFIVPGGTSAQFLKANGSVDSNTYATTSALSAYLPLAGGTLTGALYGTTASFSSTLIVGNATPTTKFEVYGSHSDTTARLYSTGNGSTLNASLDMWASEPGVTYDGSGIGNNINGSPFYGRRNSALGQSYIRFISGQIIFYTGSTTANEALNITASGAAIFQNSVTAGSLIKSGGTSSQFLKADGSIDSSAYITSASLAGYLPLTGGNLTGVVQSTANIEATAFRTDGNFELTSANTGLKSNFYDTRFYANSVSSWVVSTTAASTGGSLEFRQGFGSTIKGYVYWDASGFGLLNNIGGWSVRTNNGSNYGGTLFGNWVVRSMNVDSGSIIFYTSAGVTKGSVTWDDQGFGLINNQGDYSVLCNQGSSYGGLLRGTWTSIGNFNIIGAELSINSNATSTYSKITYRSSLDPNSYDWYTGMNYDPTAEETYYYIRYIDGNQFRVYPDGTIYINGGAFSQYSATGNYISVAGFGLYSANYSSYIRTNTTTSSYGAWDVTGAKGGYTGFVYNTMNLPHVMFDVSNGNGGLYYQTGSRWVLYYSYGNNSLGIGGTTTDATYKLYVNGNVRVVGTFNLSTLITNGAVYSIGGGLTNTNPSDIRLKEDINPLQYGLKEVMALKPVTYKWKDGSNGGQRSTGLIAQDVKDIMPEYVKNISEDNQYLGLDSYAINIVLINAIKELQAEIEILKNK